MKNKLSRFLFLLLLVMSCNALAKAQGSANAFVHSGIYLDVSGGLGLLHANKRQTLVLHYPVGGGDDYHVDVNPNNHHRLTGVIGLGAGYQWALSPRLFLRTGGSVYHAFSNDNDGVAVYHPPSSRVRGVDNPPVEAHYQYKTQSTMLLSEISLGYNINRYLVPFAKINLGLSINRAYDFQADSFNFRANSNTTEQFAYGAGVGLMANLSHAMSLGVEYDYWQLGHNNLGSSGILTGVDSSDAIKSSQNMQVLMLRLSYQFGGVSV